MPMLNWKKLHSRAWQVCWGELPIGYVYRDYSIGRGTRWYSIENRDGQRTARGSLDCPLAQAARKLAVIESAFIVANPNGRR